MIASVFILVTSSHISRTPSTQGFVPASPNTYPAFPLRHLGMELESSNYYSEISYSVNCSYCHSSASSSSDDAEI